MLHLQLYCARLLRSCAQLSLCRCVCLSGWLPGWLMGGLTSVHSIARRPCTRPQTPFGRRLMRSWVGKPLRSRAAILARLDAVQELSEQGGWVLVGAGG